MIASNFENIGELFDVSRETIARLEAYEALLEKWNKSINLVSSTTLQDGISRHFLDSLQLWPHRTQFSKWVDIGSGAGFPGLAIAILAAEKQPDSRIHLVESDAKKCSFMRTVSRETNVEVVVHNTRIENLPDLKAEIVSARALASLTELLHYSENLLIEGGICLYLKGRNCEEELERARQNWSFDHEVFQSETSPEGRILRIEKVKRVEPL